MNTGGGEGILPDQAKRYRALYEQQVLFRKLVLDSCLDNASERNTAKKKFLKPAIGTR
jgi:hypothetical protein